jgi:rubrerythrin
VPVSTGQTGGVERVEEGGEAACWLNRVCPECGRMADEDPPTHCPGCGTELPAEPEQ